MAILDTERHAASFSFQHPTLDEVMSEDDHKLERVIGRERWLAQAEYDEGNHERSRMHWRNVAELTATRRPVVVRAMEREKGLRHE